MTSRRSASTSSRATEIGVALLLLLWGRAYAAVPDVLSRFFAHDGIRDKRAVYAGDMRDFNLDKPTFGEGLPRTARTTFRMLQRSENRAIYAVEVRQESETTDYYAYLVQEGGVWKLSAVRGFALPGFFYSLLRGLQERSRSEEEELQYQNMLLMVKSDAELKAYLLAHLEDFEALASLVTEGENDRAVALADRLLIGFVNEDEGRIVLGIGGILDNSVGYLYVPPGAEPPEMSPLDYIYVEEVVEGWYVFKTT